MDPVQAAGLHCSVCVGPHLHLGDEGPEVREGSALPGPGPPGAIACSILPLCSAIWDAFPSLSLSAV